MFVRRTYRLTSPGPALLILALIAASSGCSNPSTPDPPDPAPQGNILVGAGDIALCGSPGQEATARLLDTISGEVFTAGDNAYPTGAAADFRDCYEPTWGRHKNRTHPAAGNHDYETGGAQGYYDYFGDRAGPRGLGYYAYSVAQWRVITLNSEISASASSAQAQWFRNELSASQAPCTIAIWHRPLFTSGPNLPQKDMRDLFQIAYDAGVDVVINGHDHIYERFAPQDPAGRADPARGIRQFTVGTGGVPIYVPLPAQPNSEAIRTVWGVLRLILGDGTFSWDFIPVQGSSASHDTGSGVCH